MQVLLDGWQLIYNPLSAAAFHVLEISQALQGDVGLVLALPAAKPAWLAEEVQVYEFHRSNSARNHLLWMQADMPRIARQVQADVIHTVQAAVPLFASQALFYSPTEISGLNPKRRMSVWERLDQAFGIGGLNRAVQIERKSIFNETEPPMDLVDGDRKENAFPFYEREQGLVPQTPYFLYQSDGDWERLCFLLQVWSNTASHLGNLATLVIVCFDQSEQKQIKAHSSPEFFQTLQLYCDISPSYWVKLLKEAIALIQLVEEPIWGGTAWRAMVLGVPVVGFELSLLSEAIGPAGYLVPEEDGRALSAALMTLVVEEEVLKDLRAKASYQGQRWGKGNLRRGMLRLYRQVVEF